MHEVDELHAFILECFVLFSRLLLIVLKTHCHSFHTVLSNDLDTFDLIAKYCPDLKKKINRKKVYILNHCEEK